MRLTAYLYLLAGLINVYGEYSHSMTLVYISKPLLMPLLIAFYLTGSATPLSVRDRLMAVAFAFSWIGDMALMFAGGRELYFLAGLVAFLITHLLYIVSFSMVADRLVVPVLRHRIWVAVPLATYLAALLAVVFPVVDTQMKVPVGIYSAVIATMALFALNRYKRVSDSSFALVFGGALLFMFSDSLIAVNKFLCHDTLFMGGVLIMSLYIAAQYLIAKGMLQNDNLKKA